MTTDCLEKKDERRAKNFRNREAAPISQMKK
jgi:hypothetical protein